MGKPITNDWPTHITRGEAGKVPAQLIILLLFCLSLCAAAWKRFLQLGLITLLARLGWLNRSASCNPPKHRRRPATASRGCFTR